MSAGTYLKGKTEFDNQILLGALNSMIEGIQRRGKAVLGEKTMLDTIMSFVASIDFFATSITSFLISFKDFPSLKDFSKKIISRYYCI